MFTIREGMDWPPTNLLYDKMREHSVWYSGDASLIANFYSIEKNKTFIDSPFANDRITFWGRQHSNGSQIFNHVPIAGDISEMSSSLLFAESALVKIADNKDNARLATQEKLDELLDNSGFHEKMLEVGETASAIGGTFVKIAWDKDLSEYPIPVVEQADKAIPYFKFGMLTSVIFWQTVRDEVEDGKQKEVYRLLEHYKKGSIEYTLYKGKAGKLGNVVDLNSIEETKDQEQYIDTKDMLLAAYFPNMLPNRLIRSSSLGRSDYLSIEGLMDSLDETYSAWCKEITLGLAKVYVPERYLINKDGRRMYNPDETTYVELDVDPINSNEKNLITPQQFNIRADAFEKTMLNQLERIITSAGYSPQSFGLNISGRAESGTALGIRERKSFITKAKKEKYFYKPMMHIVNCMMFVYSEFLQGKDIDPNEEISISFSDSITNNLAETSESINKLNSAVAVSIEVKVRMLHPEWSELEIIEEVNKIKEENMIGSAPTPDNFDLSQLNLIEKESNEENAEENAQVEDDGTDQN